MKKKLLQLFYVLSITGILLLFVNGCLWGLGQKPYTAVNYYDLATPPQIVLKKVQAKFIPLASTEPAKYKMVYRDSDCRMILDDYNKWIQPPAMLITRYLQGAFKQNGITPKGSELIISGNIFMFRIDLQKNTASLGVNYVIKTSLDDVDKVVFQNSTVFSHKFAKQAPENFVKAMSKCADDLVITIQKNIEKIQQHKQTEKKLK
jgi:hypothetical protein